MAYDYYCMQCGKQLNQDIVLFDMQYLLTRDKDKRLQILKFRITQTQLQQLISGGAVKEGGYREVTLTFQKVMEIMANGNNLDDPAIAKLTREEVKAYIAQANNLYAFEPKTQKEFDIFGDEEEEKPKEEEVVVQEEYHAPESIQALEAKDESNTDRAITQSILRGDFEILQAAFLLGDTLTLQIKAEQEDDNDGRKVLYGYNVHFLTGNIYLSIDARICSKCGSPVFSHAGTAKHQAIAFIGNQSSGKTSTILALTHYAQNHMMIDLGDLGDESGEIWKGTETIPEVATVELLEKNYKLQDDLKNYSKGLSPRKTEAGARENAYCATFRIKNKIENKYYLLTLTDLPGELCQEDGTVKDEVVRTHFPVALSCDAYIACFDTISINPNGGGIVNWVMNVCRWTDTFQKMRASENGVETYVPTMMLFTKCKDLEAPAAVEKTERNLLPIAQTYSLRKEKQQIVGNKLYNFVREQFNEFGQLSRAYHAMMRCSPFGYAAPSKQDLEEGYTGEQHSPRPKNVDILMRWLLSVSGCIPTEAEYRRDPLSPTPPFRLNNFCISRPQLRTQNPLVNQELEESLARCALFENPGRFDERMLVQYDTPWQLVFTRMESKLRPNSNAR